MPATRPTHSCNDTTAATFGATAVAGHKGESANQPARTSSGSSSSSINGTRLWTPHSLQKTQEKHPELSQVVNRRNRSAGHSHSLTVRSWPASTTSDVCRPLAKELSTAFFAMNTAVPRGRQARGAQGRAACRVGRGGVPFPCLFASHHPRQLASPVRAHSKRPSKPAAPPMRRRR